MNTQTSKFLDNLLTECALDERIENGVFDVYNTEHLTILAEKIASMGISSDDVDSLIESVQVEEGKYPDRQAYNKEGWLVTFPSKEYRDRAIKKGTHSISDPTHGKGGMNLYYKRRGKQKRQTQQNVTTTNEPEQQATTPAQKSSDQQLPQGSEPEGEEMPPEPIADTDVDAMLAKGLGDKYVPKYAQNAKSQGGENSALPPSDGGKETAPSDGSAPAPAAAPQAPAAPTPPPPPPFVELSKKFAAQKGWAGTPYGEWRDRSGTAMAVEALSGEVVPIKTNDREELKLFVEKNK